METVGRGQSLFVLGHRRSLQSKIRHQISRPSSQVFLRIHTPLTLRDLTRLRDWSLIMGKAGGGAENGRGGGVLPLQKKKGWVGKSIAMLNMGGGGVQLVLR